VRAQLHKALLDLCFERGLGSVTVADLCRRAGVSEGDFHRRYADVEDAFCDFYEEERDAILAAIATATDGIEDWRERMRVTAYVIYRALGRDERVTNFTTSQVSIAGERARRIQIEGLTAMFDLLDEGREEAGHGAGLTRGTAEAVTSGILAQLNAAAAKGPLPPEREVVPEMLYLALLPYLGQEAAREELEITPPPA
jgi:AcrR family transcriptional regulator